MLNHWAGTAENGYLGSQYGGQSILEACCSPSAPKALFDKLASKLAEDVPILESNIVEVSRAKLSDGVYRFAIETKTAETFEVEIRVN